VIKRKRVEAFRTEGKPKKDPFLSRTAAPKKTRASRNPALSYALPNTKTRKKREGKRNNISLEQQTTKKS